MYSKWMFFVLIGIVIAIFIFRQQTSNISFQNISIEEKKFLNKHFQNIFTTDFGYTLVGAKPVSFDELQKVDVILNKDERIKIIHYLKEIFANSETFLLKYTDISPNNGELVLIHLPTFKRTLENELPHIDPSLSVEKVLTLLQKEDTFFWTLFKNPILLGTVLGYGKENSQFFTRRVELGFYLGKIPFVRHVPFCPTEYGIFTPLLQLEQIQRNNAPYIISKPHPNNRFSSYQEEWNWISKISIKNSKDELFSPLLFQFPRFVSKKGKETENLLKKYRKAKAYLENLFATYDFVDGVIHEVHKTKNHESSNSLCSQNSSLIVWLYQLLQF
jgi:hypothetical protein